MPSPTPNNTQDNTPSIPEEPLTVNMLTTPMVQDSSQCGAVDPYVSTDGAHLSAYWPAHISLSR